MGRFIGWITVPEYGLDAEESVVWARNEIDEFIRKIEKICVGRVSIVRVAGQNAARVIFLADFRNNFEHTLNAFDDIKHAMMPFEEFINASFEFEDSESDKSFLYRVGAGKLEN